MADVGEAKAAARERARAGRRAGPRADERALARQALGLLEALAGPRRVTAYASFGTEPDTSVLLDELAEGGYSVLLPRIVGTDLAWVSAEGGLDGSALIPEPMGPPEPLLPLRAMLVPALAVTADGARLGKGGGFYDRVIAALPEGEGRPPIIAIVRDEDVWERASIPMAAHDMPVDAILTPTRVIDCR